MDIVEWLASLKPRTTYHGDRAVKMVVHAMRSSERDLWEEEVLQRILTHFSYVR